MNVRITDSYCIYKRSGCNFLITGEASYQFFNESPLGVLNLIIFLAVFFIVVSLETEYTQFNKSRR